MCLLRTRDVLKAQAVADFLKELKSYCLRVVRQDLGPGQSHRLAADTITYVITVPALWCAGVQPGAPLPARRTACCTQKALFTFLAYGAQV